MIVLLPPSETKRGGGAGPPLSLDALSSPTLGPLRAALVDELVTLAGDRSACRRALGISASQDFEIDRNAALRSAATLPAVSRYTGVLYDALDVESLRGAAAGRARARLAINSALFGLLRADDPYPHTASPPRQNCRDNRAWPLAGDHCSNPCWPSWPPTSWLSICDRGPTLPWAGCLAL